MTINPRRRPPPSIRPGYAGAGAFGPQTSVDHIGIKEFAAEEGKHDQLRPGRDSITSLRQLNMMIDRPAIDVEQLTDHRVTLPPGYQDETFQLTLGERHG